MVTRTDNRSVVLFAMKGQDAEGYGNHWTCNGRYGVGSLPRRLQSIFYSHDKFNREDYARPILQTIYSYATPIAWLIKNDHDEYVWVIPDVKYSVTTAKHQGYLWQLSQLPENVFTVRIPWDCSKDEYKRVINGEMRFVSYPQPGTVPGPRFILK